MKLFIMLESLQMSWKQREGVHLSLSRLSRTLRSGGTERTKRHLEARTRLVRSYKAQSESSHREKRQER